LPQECPLSRLRERAGVRAAAKALTPTLSRKRERGQCLAVSLIQIPA